MICIPSYNRPIIKTLTVLKDYPKDKIKIFVVEDEYDIYKETNPEYEIIIGKLGIANQRQFILDYFKDGDEIIYMDDDIISINVNIEEFITKAFIECKNHNAFIWGIYPVNNPFFYEKQPYMTTGLKFIIGCFYGVIKKNTELVICNNKDDVERSIQYFIRDGIVLRFNHIAVKTKFYSKGGLGILKDRLSNIINEVEYLSATYPNYGKIKIRKNGIYEFPLKFNSKKSS